MRRKREAKDDLVKKAVDRTAMAAKDSEDVDAAV